MTRQSPGTSHPINLKLYTHRKPAHPLSPQPLVTTSRRLSLSPTSSILHRSGIILRLSFYDRLISLSMSSSTSMWWHMTRFPSFLRLSNIPVYGCAPFYLSIHPSMNIFRLLPLLGCCWQSCIVYGSGNTSVRSWFWFFCIYTQSANARACGHSVFNFLMNLRYFSQWQHHFAVSWRVHKVSVSSASSPTLVVSCHFDDGHSNWCEVRSYCSFDVCFPDD